MSAATRIERDYRVRFDEAGPDGRLRSSGYLRFAQDLAWIHSEVAGFDRRFYAERGLTWLVRAIELDLLEDAAYGTELTVSTEVVGFRRVWARRRSEFRTAESERPTAVAITDWVLLNAAGRPVRPPAQILAAFGGPPAEFTPLRLPRLEPNGEPAATVHEFGVRRSELDPMAHVNNAAYLDFMDEHYLGAVRMRHGMPLPRRYRAEFIRSAAASARLVGRAWAEPRAWCYRLEDDTGDELLRARLEADPASWVGG